MKVKLINKEALTGTGYVWEYSLMQAGWNTLKEEERYGLTTDDCFLFNCSSVMFPYCNNLKLTLCADEMEAA